MFHPAFFNPVRNLILAVLLLIGPASVPAAQVVLQQMTQTYTGSAITPAISTVPAGIPVTALYKSLATPAPAASTETVFDNIPAVLPLSTTSIGFSAVQVSALGNYVRLAGSARNIESCDVLMVTWAKAADWPALAAANPAGYIHNIGLTFYTISPTNSFVPLGTLSKDFLIPWRPLVQSNGQPWPFNGYAFKITFPFPAGFTLPEQVMVMLEYDTENSGFTPIGAKGPYNSLNIASGGDTPLAGTDVNPDVVLKVTREIKKAVPTDVWSYPNSGWSATSGPIITLRANTRTSKTAPVIPGSYQVTAMAGTTSTEGTTTGTLTITSPTFNTWRQQQFTPEQIAAGRAEPGVDADNDGMTNFAEYAMGTLPGTTTTTSPVTFDPENLSISLVRPRWLTGVSYLTEETSDFVRWTPVPLQIVSTDSQTETVRASSSAGARSSGRSFLRFRFGP